MTLRAAGLDRIDRSACSIGRLGIADSGHSAFTELATPRNSQLQLRDLSNFSISKTSSRPFTVFPLEECGTDSKCCRI